MALKVGELYADASLNTGGFTQGISTMMSKVGGFKTMALGAFGAVAGAVASLGAGMAASVGAAASWEESMVELEKVMDPETAAAMEGKIKDMSTEMGLGKDQIAAVAASAGRLGVKGTENVEQFTQVVSKMGVATDVTGDQAGVALKKIIDMTDSSVKDIGRMGSAINELSNNMGTTSSEIIRATQRSAATLNQLGASSQEILALNATMNTVSPTARLAATSMEMMGDALMDPKAVKAMANAMGINVDKFRQMIDNSPVKVLKQVAEFIASGSKKAKSLQNQLGKTGLKFARFGQVTGKQGDAQQMVNEQWGNATSLQNEFAKANDTLYSRMSKLQDTVGNLGIAIGDKLMKPVKNLLEKIKPIVENITTWVEEQGSLNDLFEKLSDFLGQETMEDLKQAGKNLAGFFSTLKDVLGPTMKKMLPVVKNLFQILADLMAGDFGGAGQNIKEYLQSIGDVVGTLFKEIVEHTGLSKLVEKIQNVIKIIENLIKKIPDVGGAAKKFGGQVAGFFGFGGGDKNLQTLIKDWTSKGFGQSKFVAPGDVSSLKKYIQEMNMGVEEQRKTIVTLLAKVAQNIKDPKEQAKQLGVAIERLKKKINTVDLSKLNPKDFIGEFGKLDLTLPQLGMERAKLIGQLDTALAGKVQSDISTETRADFTIAESVTVEERQDIEELNRMIQRTYDQWLRQVKGEK